MLELVHGRLMANHWTASILSLAGAQEVREYFELESHTCYYLCALGCILSTYVHCTMHIHYIIAKNLTAFLSFVYKPPVIAETHPNTY